MFQKIYQKLQTREGITLIASLTLVVVALVGLTMVFGGPDRDSKSFTTPDPVLRVSGTGEVTASPDIARFTYSISKDAATIAEARNTVATTGNDLIKKLKDAGIAEKDIKTESISTYPKYENRSTGGKCPEGMACPVAYNSVVVGYTVTNTFSVKVRNLDNVSKIAELLTNAKIFTLNGPDFSIDDQQAINDQAQALAITDAKKQAGILAEQLGVRLGKIVDFQVDSGAGSPIPMYDRAMMASAPMEKSIAPELPTGDTKITSHVTISFRIR